MFLEYMRSKTLAKICSNSYALLTSADCTTSIVRGENEDDIYDAILADEPLYPIHMPRLAVNILQKLLTREPELRLGRGSTGAQDVMNHEFFKDINWDDLYHKRMQPTFTPQIKSAMDTGNFDTEFTSITPVLTPVQGGGSCPPPLILVYLLLIVISLSELTKAMQEEFRGFSTIVEAA